jgi:alpha-glucosidase
VQLGESSTYDGRYAGAHFTVAPEDPTRFRYTLADAAVTTGAPVATPWRTAVIGDLADVVESDLVQDLSPPSRLRDTSWIEPGRAAWSWWSGGDSDDFELQKDYVDYAAERGWEYVLVDAGWDAETMPALVRYAQRRDVRIMLWARYAPSNPQDRR